MLRFHPLLSIFLLPLNLLARNLPDSEFLKGAPEQRIDRQYVRNFPYQHDKGFLLSIGFGPAWNQAIQNPSAAALRFGGQIGIGFVPVRNLALHANVWGNYLEQASFWGSGPGMTYFLTPSQISLGLKLGVGNVSGKTSDNKNFRETVLVTEFCLAKYWWLSASNSLGLSWANGFYGFTLAQGSLSSMGWSTGLRIEYLYN